MNHIKTMKLALEALEPFITPNWAGSGVDEANAAYTALSKALAEQPAQQEPVGEWGDGRSDAKRILWKPGYVVAAKVGDKLYASPQPAQQEQPVAMPGWKWMAHPSRNGGQPIPVQIFEEDGVTYYRPFDTESTEFEWSEKDEDWCVITQQPTEPHEPIGKAHLCDLCSTPFDGEDECTECGHGSATKKDVYEAPQPVQRKPLMLWTEAQHERAYRNSPELHKDVKSLSAFKRVAKEIAAMYGIKENT